MRIAIGEFGNETNSFAKGTSSFEMLAPRGWLKAEELIETFRGTNSYLGGAIKAADEEGGIELVPLSSVKISAGPTVSDEAAAYIHGHIAEELSAVKDSIDGVFFAIHGGGCTESADSLEIETLKAIRGVVGNEMPITSSLDLHSNIHQGVIDLLQGLFVIKENPHTDCGLAGYKAMKSLISILKGESDPKMAIIPLPMLITPATGNTYNEPMKSAKEYFAEYCKKHDLIDTSFCHGFSAADHPLSSSSVLVVAEGYDPTEHAKELARYFWARRAEFDPISLTPDQAIDAALEKVKDGFVVINEISDNPGSGCPGDGTYTLKAMLDRDLPGTIFQYIKDPEVAKQAHEAGVGAKIDIVIGGKTDDMHGKPIEVKDVEVLALSDGIFDYRTPNNKGLVCNLGLSARLRHSNVEFVVVTARVQALDDGMIYATGGDPKNYKIIALKSANHFRGYFEPIADAIVTSDPPGIRCSNLTTYPYKRMRSPLYPLDRNTEFNI